MKAENVNEAERHLSEREQKRAKIIEDCLKEYTSKGYQNKELTIPLTKANINAPIVCMPLIFIFFVLWFSKYSVDVKSFINSNELLIYAIAVVVSLLIHELIHGLVWGLAIKGQWNKIELGFVKEQLTPYCTCLSPLTKVQYVLGSIMPTIILGIIPSIISLTNGSFALLLFGLTEIIGGGGDIQIVLKLLTSKTSSKELLCVDHPTKVGLIVVEK